MSSYVTYEEIAKLEVVTRLFRVRRTVLEMLKDRGYNVDKDAIEITKQQFIEKFTNNLNIKREDLFIQTEKVDDPSDRIFVRFPEVSKKVGCSVVKDCATKMNTDNVSIAILVIQHGLTPQAKASISEVAMKYRIETFQDSELLVNIKNHELVPAHKVLTSEEEKNCWQNTKSKKHSYLEC